VLRGDAIRSQAQAEADADRIRAAALLVRAEVDAEAARRLNESHNMLTDASRQSLFRQKLLDKMEGIIRESVRPMERIEGIKILSVNGLGGAPQTTGSEVAGVASAATVSLPEQMVSSALRFRAQAPLVDSLLREIGVDPAGIEQATRSLIQAPGVAGSA
jgi:uncharacterized membrane protein YqiK